MEHRLGRTYCAEQCNQDGECKGHMQRMEGRLPDRVCGIVTEGTCDKFVNATINMECFQINANIIGDLVTIPKCEAKAWSGCYRKFSK